MYFLFKNCEIYTYKYIITIISAKKKIKEYQKLFTLNYTKNTFVE